MLHRIALLICGLLLLSPFPASPPANPPSTAIAPAYTKEGKLLLPADYREWLYLSSGIDMSYSAHPSEMGGSMFDNVFVNPEAYKVFTNTGTWPDKTMLVMETREAQSKGSINRQGHFETANIMGLEVHVKDEARFPDKWAFFTFDNPSTASLVPRSADCYSCHQQHAAVDTTFIQFYPTLIGIAKQKGTFRESLIK